MAINTSERTNILKLTAGLFNAAPGAAYLAEFTSVFEGNGHNLQALAITLGNSGTFKLLYPNFQTANEFATKFLTTLGLQGNQEAIDYVTAQHSAGVPKAQIIFNALLAIDATTSPIYADAKAILVNKALVALNYSVTLGASSGDLATLQGVVAKVTADPASVTAANNANTGGSGQTFTLTSSVQALVGSAGNDIFIAGDEGGKATLNAGDSISGGAGTDTLKLFNATGAVNTANFASTTISSVENVEATLSATAQTLDVSGNADVVKATLVNGFDGAVTLGLNQQAGLTGAINTTGAAATFTFKNATGLADSATLNLSGANTATSGVNIAAVETLNVVATGTNVLGSFATDATKLVVTGAGSVSATLKAAAGAASLVKTIDGSAATGNLTIDNSSAGAQVESIKTGSGNDIYTTKYTNLGADDVIDLGAGTDSLRFSDAATFNSAATKAVLAKVAGVEQLGTVGATLTIDGDFVSQTSYYTDGAAGNVVLNNVANNADVNFGKTDVVANATGVNTVGMKLGANTLNVNLAGSTTGASVVGGVVATVGDGLAITGSAIINVKSTGTVGQAANVLDLTAADNQSVVITGSQNLTLVAKAAVGTTGFSIDGSAFTGVLTVTGTSATDIVKGGSGNDIISGGAGAISDTLTGGAGNDKFIIIAGATAATADVITDFATAADTIAFGGAVLAANVTKGAVAVADFAAALAAANLVLTNASVGAVTQVNVQQVGSDTYAFFNDGLATGADMAVKLTGVALAGVAAADFVSVV